METKTKVEAPTGSQDILITRDFDLPADLLFKAFTEPDLVAQWMGTKVIKLENKMHGGWQFETCDAKGNKVFEAHGVIHKIEPGKSITRTFEMTNAQMETQLEFLDFEPLSENTSRLRMQIVYRSAEDRARTLQLPFVQGINWAHNRLEEMMKQPQQ